MSINLHSLANRLASENQDVAIYFEQLKIDHVPQRYWAAWNKVYGWEPKRFYKGESQNIKAVLSGKKPIAVFVDKYYINKHKDELDQRGALISDYKDVGRSDVSVVLPGNRDVLEMVDHFQKNDWTWAGNNERWKHAFLGVVLGYPLKEVIDFSSKYKE